jgi:hypothetical protein
VIGSFEEIDSVTKLQQIERDVKNLSPAELADFRKWFHAFDAALWDQQLERDKKAGKLDRLRDEALAEHAARRTKEL